MRSLFSFPVRSIRFVAVTEARSFFEEHQPRFSVSFPATDMPLEMVQMIPTQARKAAESRRGLMTASSARRPYLRDMTENNTDMRELNLKLHDINQSLDSVLRDMPGEIAVQMWERKTRAGYDADRWGVGLIGLRFDAAAVKVPTWEQLTEQVTE